MDIKKIIDEIQKDPEIKSKEKLIICLNKECEAMLEDAFHLRADGDFRKLPQGTYSGGEEADEAVIRMSEDGNDLVSYIETRRISRDQRPNGIRVCDMEFPCVVFFNTGRERLTVGMKDIENSSVWVAPGDYTFEEDRDMSDPEVRKALERFSRSPKVLKEMEEVRRQVQEQMGQV